MATHRVALCFCPLNTDIVVVALSPCRGFAISATPPQLHPAAGADCTAPEREAAFHY